ncbi:MAG: hypothetical protein OES59_08275 [Gammaproteobacteria bacterium]|nr:hypothetical protein [Gammaproteobacteria bacterium]
MTACVDGVWRRKGVFSALYRHVESLVAAEPSVIGLLAGKSKHPIGEN